MRVCLMVEGQEDVSWEHWRALASACEAHGYDALFRSDHYQSVVGIEARGSLDAWSTICGLAAVTGTLRLGTLVSPASFRHPSVLAKAVVTADHISGGRIELGIGAGWLEREHAAYGFPFHPTGTRMAILEEQLEIITRQWSGEEFSFDGRHYRLDRCRALPAPRQRPRPPIVVGGLAKPRSAALAARFADEYNTIYASPEQCRERRAAVERACEEIERDPASIGFSLMTGCLIGIDEGDIRSRASRLAEQHGEPTSDPGAYIDELAGRNWIIGTPSQAAEQLLALADAGVERVMLQHHLHWELEPVSLVGREVIPAVRS